MINKTLIRVLYKIVSEKSNEKLIAWDFPPDTFKKAYFALKKYLGDKGIPIMQPQGLEGKFADWPHFSVAFIPLDTSDEKINKIKLAGPLFTSSLKTKDVRIFEGRIAPQTFIVWALAFSNPEKYKKFVDFIQEITDKPKNDKEYTPHVSLAVCDAKYTQQLKELAPELEKLLKRFSNTYMPTQLQVWEDFRIIDIESLEFK